ncbi:MAG TPA: IS66 family transposase [Phycisphaerae bacterium]|jgi:transposase|nr:IS66 family transposase [Phycisphaerae bacterium]
MSLADPAAGLPPTTAEQLPDEVATLKRMVLELLASLHERDRNIEGMRHRIDLLLRRLYGPRGERFNPDQLLLFAEMAAGQETITERSPEPAAASKPRRRCRPHGRRRLPDNLPREPRHHELSEAERTCPACGRMRVDIGTDRSEQLDYRPASLFVVEHFVHKYACPCYSKRQSQSQGQQACPGQESKPKPAPQSDPEPAPAPTEPTPTPTQVSAGPEPVAPGPRPTDPSQPPQPEAQPFLLQGPGEVVIAAPKPAMPIAKGLPGPGLLAHLIVSKCVDHLPLHRLERVYQRQGLFLHRSTLCDWMAACADLLRPLYDLMVSVVLQSRALHTDDTTVKLQELVTHLLSTARFWVYLGDAAHPYNVFDFTVNRKRDGPQQFLANYQGYLHADAFSGYDGLYLPDPRTAAAARIIEVACNAHARRKFYEARGSDALRSHQALAYYRQLYELERGAKDFSDEQRLQMRQDLAVPILGQFRTWLEAQRPQVLPKSPMAEALGYALNNWAALVRYTEAGFLAIDNNAAEREMKRIAIGRKNWLTVGSPRGGQTAAVLFSFTSTCQRLGVEPWHYLRDVLEQLPSHPPDRLVELLPDEWAPAQRAAAVADPPGDVAAPLSG